MGSHGAYIRAQRVTLGVRSRRLAERPAHIDPFTLAAPASGEDLDRQLACRIACRP